MNQVEVKCDKCVEVSRENSTETIEKLQIASFSVVKCIDCSQNLCTSCLQQHQELAVNVNHRLELLISAEINNNNLIASDLTLNDCLKLSNMDSFMPKCDQLSLQVNEVTSSQNNNCILTPSDDNKEMGSINFNKQNEQVKQMGQLQQQNLMDATNIRLSLIESEINNTFNFYGQVLKGDLKFSL
jgi:hypothetical protein